VVTVCLTVCHTVCHKEDIGLYYWILIQALFKLSARSIGQNISQKLELKHRKLILKVNIEFKHRK
jgi:hypothetical protein